jgi:hypothetical protein
LDEAADEAADEAVDEFVIPSPSVQTLRAVCGPVAQTSMALWGPVVQALVNSPIAVFGPVPV